MRPALSTGTVGAGFSAPTFRTLETVSDPLRWDTGRVRWESLVGRIVVVLAVGALIGWVGFALWNRNGLPPSLKPCRPHQTCIGAGGVQGALAPPHLAMVLVLAGVWLVFGFLVIRNRDR